MNCAIVDADFSTRLGKECQLFTYKGAGHAFMEHTNLERCHEGSAKQTWPRTLDFLYQHLKGASLETPMSQNVITRAPIPVI